MNRRLLNIILLLIPFIGSAQRGNRAEVRYCNSFDDPAKNPAWMNSHTIVLGSDSTRKYVSKTDTQNPYSAGIEVEIPKELQRKNFRITIKCDVNLKPGAHNQLVVSIAKKDSSVFWDGMQLGESAMKLKRAHSTNDSITVNETRDWFTFRMESLIPGNLPIDSRIKIYIWNADGKSETDVDEMDITFTEAPLTSFLPK